MKEPAPVRGRLTGPGMPLLAGLLLLAAPGGPEAAPSNPRPGRVFVFSGATGLLIRSIDAPSGQHKARFGSAMAGLGDVNGDGVPDLAVGAPRADAGGTRRAGSVSIFSGSTGTLLRIVTAPASAPRMLFGWSLSAAGDQDGDGAGDLLVGAPRARVPGAGRAGEAWLVGGGDGAILAGLRAPAPRKGARFGDSVAAGPDADGDGLQELMAGAPRERVGGREGQGRVYLFDPNGRATDVLESPVRQRNALFGRSLAMVPDVDGDGLPEIAAGADGLHAGTGDYSGGVFLLTASVPGGFPVGLARAVPPVPQANFGFAVAGLPDLDGDGAGDLAATAPDQDTSSLAGGAAFVLGGAPPDPNRPLGAPLPLLAGLSDPDPGRFAFYGGSIALLQDLTGDGLPELVIGSEHHKNGAGIRTGRAYVVEAATGALVYTIPSPTGDSCSRFGWSVAAAGDVDGDGTEDFAVGAPFHRVSVRQKAGRCF